MSADADAWLAAGLEAMRRGRASQAVRAFDRAAAAGGDRHRIRVLKGRALLAAGATLEAAVVAEEILADAPDDPAALAILSTAHSVGWVREAVDALRLLVARPEARADVWLAAARMFEWFSEPELALAHADGALRVDPNLLGAWLIRARRGAEDALERCESLADPRRLPEVAEAALIAGDIERAERIYARIGDDDSRAWLAELALWRGDLERAEALANGNSCRAHSVRGGAAVLRGDFAAALEHLDRALAQNREDSTARHWRAEALRRMGRLPEALEEIDLAVAHSERYFVTGEATRLLAAFQQLAHEAVASLSPEVYAELVEALAPLAGEADREMLAGSQTAVARYLESAIAALGGNRSNLPTRVEHGRLVPIPVRRNARAASRRLQESIRAHDVDEVLAGFDALIAEYGERPTIHCHRGELQLWLGRWDDAERSFTRALAIDHKTRWAWIGLAAARLGAGDLTGAGRAFRDGAAAAYPPGRTTYVYRGELAFLRGDLDAAVEDLGRSLRMNPERLSAELLLARVESARGDRESCAARVARAAETAPALFRDVAAAGAGSDPDERARVALAMMRGNRSSSFVTYFTAAGKLRFVPPPRIVAVRLIDPASVPA